MIAGLHFREAHQCIQAVKVPKFNGGKTWTVTVDTDTMDEGRSGI